MKIPLECQTTEKKPNIVISDPTSKNRRSKFRLENPQKASIQVIEVDDCTITQGVRCDYLLILPNGQELYIELKGSDVQHAVKQIARTIEKLTQSQSATKLCFIASTRCPINSAQIQTLKKRFKKKYNAKLTVKNGEIVHRCSP